MAMIAARRCATERSSFTSTNAPVSATYAAQPQLQSGARPGRSAVYATRHCGARGISSAARTLDLSRRKRSEVAWIAQATQFYTNALADETLVAQLGRFCITREQLMEAQAQLVAVDACLVARESHKQIAQKTTKACNTVLAELHLWMRDFLDIARVAL